MYLRLNLSRESQSFAHVLVAESFIDRLLGLRRRGASSVLLWTSSVHTIGWKHPIHVVELSDGGVVASVDYLKPWRFHSRDRPGFILELPIEVEPPSLGAQVIALPCGVCPEPSYFAQRRLAIWAMRRRV